MVKQVMWERPEVKALMDSAQDFISVFGLDFRHLFVNRAVAEGVGIPADQYRGKSLSDMGATPETEAEVQAHFKRVIETGETAKFESRVRRPGGRGTVVLQVIAAPVRDDHGKIHALLSISRDVTDIRRTEALRSAQHEVMSRIAAGATLPDLMTLMVNLVEEGLPGRRAALLLLSEDRRHFERGHAPNVPPELIDALCATPIGPDNGNCGIAAATKKESHSTDIAHDPAWTKHRAIAAKHGLRACWSHPVLAKDGELLGTFSIFVGESRKFRRVEQQVVAEAALAAAISIQYWRTQETLLETHERFQALAEHAANLVAVNDANGVTRYVSPAVESILGYKPEDMIGRAASFLVHPDDVPAVLESRAKLREEIGSEGTLRYRLRHKNGTWRILEAVSRSSVDHHGNIIMVVSARDVTEREEASEALRHSEDRLERALEASGLGMWDWLLETGELFLDEHSRKILDISNDDRRPPHIDVISERTHPDDQARRVEAIASVLRGAKPFYEIDYRIRMGGGWKWISSRGQVTVRDDAGKALRVTGTIKDIDAERRMEDRLERALDASGVGMYDWEVDSGNMYLDERCLRALGHEQGSLTGNIEAWLGTLRADFATPTAHLIEAHLKGQTPYFQFEAPVRGGDGQWRWIRARGKTTERDAQGNPARVTGTLQNIDSEHRMQEAFEAADTRNRLLLEATDEGIIGLDPDGTCTFVNPAATRLLGLQEDRILGQTFDTVVRHTSDEGGDLIGDESPIVHCLLEGKRFVGANELFWTGDGHALPVEYSVSPLTTEGRASGAVLIFRDVSDKRSLAQQLQFQALHDPLTGLINRRGFEKKLGQMLNSAHNEGRQHALCYIDLDHFKLVNDTCGHAAGDELLRQLPQVLSPIVRRADTIARLGGDEFALLLEDCPLEQAARIAEAVRDAVRDFRFVWQYRTFSIGASIGVVGITGESQGLVSVLSAADTACYVAKDQGPNHVHVSYPHDLAIIRRRGEMRWVARLKTALEESQFRLHYMSIVALDRPDAVPVGHELLIRLLDAKGDLIMPGAFLPAAERYQLMPQIDHWVIENALRYIGQTIVPNAQLAAHRFGINLSGESLRDQQLLDTIRHTLERHGVPPGRVYFEITETAAIANLGAAVDFMRGLRELGCKLALDDFGSGMSSFSYLKHLPVDYLKIDGSFIKDVVENPVDQAIVRAVQAVGSQMGIATIAEYVENAEVLKCLRGMGVNFGQGYAIHKPQALEDFPVQNGQALAQSA